LRTCQCTEDCKTRYFPTFVEVPLQRVFTTKRGRHSSDPGFPSPVPRVCTWLVRLAERHGAVTAGARPSFAGRCLPSGSVTSRARSPPGTSDAASEQLGDAADRVCESRSSGQRCAAMSEKQPMWAPRSRMVCGGSGKACAVSVWGAAGS
jgi:hypothetical protein